MSNSVAKLIRQSTGPEMNEYLESELYQLCETIQDNGNPLSSGGIATIKFIDIFRLHSVVSNRLANVLIKARKGGYIEFDGEILMQGKDDNKLITLKKMPKKVAQVTKTTHVAKK